MKKVYHRAFFDLLKEKVAETPPAYDWITRLYGEIKKRLLALLRAGSDLSLEIESKLDEKLFDQMIRNDAFEGKDMWGLTEYVFAKILQLGSPARDKATRTKEKEVLEHLAQPSASFATAVPLFVRNANACIDWIYEDIEALKKAATSGKGYEQAS